MESLYILATESKKKVAPVYSAPWWWGFYHQYFKMLNLQFKSNQIWIFK